MADQKFTIIFKKAPDYKIFPCQNVYGGPVLDGSGILMNVCIDHFPTPSYQVHPVNPDGRSVDASKIIDQVQVGNAEREILCGVFMTKKEAKQIVAWLTNHIEKMEKNDE